MSDLNTLWEAIFSNLRATECLRERISKRPAFDKQAAFRYCDRDGDGRLSIQDVMLTLHDHNGAQLAKDKKILLIINKFKSPLSKRGGAANISGVGEAFITQQEYIDEITPKIDLAQDEP